jgi:hypothetical protein
MSDTNPTVSEAEVQAIQEKAAAEMAAKAAAAQAAAVTATEGGSKDGAKILLKNGQSRIDYIRGRWRQGISRGQITKEVNMLKVDGSKDVPYQIIFSATKDVPGGPAKPVSAEQPVPTEQAAAE